jgi:hypothetical protein
LLVALGVAAWRAAAIPVSLAVSLSLIAVAADANRLQPWLYQYLLMVVCLVGASRDPESRAHARLACRLVVAAVYGWSGLQKLNPNFVNEVFPWLLTPARGWLPGLPWDSMGSLLGWGVGLVETAIGAGLLVPRTRRVAGIAALVTHLVVLGLIGPFGLRWNPVVWPWNVAMGILVVALFVRPGLDAGVTLARAGGSSIGDAASSGADRRRPWAWSDALRGLAILLAVVMPAANFADAWDAYLSWSLYSGVPPEGTVHVGAGLEPEFPESVRRLGWGGGPDGLVLPLVIWSVEELGVPVYPEDRVFRAIGRALCARFADSGALRLELVRKHRFATRESAFFSCADLAAGRVG